MSLLSPSSLDPRFQEPPGWQWGSFERAAGRRLRYGWIAAGNPRGVIVHLPGLSEPAEKNFETFSELHAQGYTVLTLDWFGQGGSGRYLANVHKRHAADFAEDVADLEYILHQIPACAGMTLPQWNDARKILLAHSMGAHIGLRYLARHPDVFSCAAMTAPMIGIGALGFLPQKVALALTGLCAALWPEAYVPGGGDWFPWKKQPDEGRAHLSSDPARNGLQNIWFAARPEIRIGGITFGWLDAAMRSCAVLRAELPRIRTPILIALAGREVLVDNRAIERAARILPYARLIRLPQALHEILMERETLRRAFLDAFYAFVREQAGGGKDP